MGWCRGSYLAEEIWDDLRSVVPQEQRHVFAKKIYEKFCDYDADDWNHNSFLLRDAGVKFDDE